MNASLSHIFVGTNGTSTPPPSPSQGPRINSKLLVGYINISIAALICLFVLLRLPRGFARLWNASDWRSGHLLGFRSGTSQASARSSSQTTSKVDESVSVPASDLIERGELQRDSNKRPPPHIPAYPAPLRRAVALLRRSTLPGYSNFQIVLMGGYFGILFFALAYLNKYLLSGTRPAWIAVAQLPFLYAFATKANVLGALLGISYPSLNFFHRFMGTLIVLASNVHGIGQLYPWAKNGKLDVMLQDPSNRWGLVAMFCMDILFLSSISFFRKRAYKIFRATHLVGYLLVVPAIYLHMPDSTTPYIIAVSVIYLLDRVVRVLKTRLVTATIAPLSSLASTRVEIKGLNHGWRAGQHVRVRVLSTSLGWFNWLEAHPFTIASAPETSDGLVLICKKAGDWTSRLFDMANDPRDAVEAGLTGRKVRLLIEGPYGKSSLLLNDNLIHSYDRAGGPGHAIFSSYSSVVMITGGSGIAFALSTIQDLIQKELRGESRVQAIELVWIVKDQDTVVDLLPSLRLLLRSFPYISISIYYTRPQRSRPAKDTEKKDKVDSETIDDNCVHDLDRLDGHPISFQAGRPGKADLVDVFERTIARVNVSQGAAKGLLVGVCGPHGLDVDVLAAVESIGAKKNNVSGVGLHIEVFDF
ncbi:Ferric reductase like transmembrane component domain containing protein [Amanita muscaria]